MSISLIALIFFAATLLVGAGIHLLFLKKLKNYDGMRGVAKRGDAQDSNIIGRLG